VALAPVSFGASIRTQEHRTVALPSLARVPAPPDAILGLSEAARADTRSGKINLSSGVFVDETGTTPVLASVTEA
jgi:hypothetical protein